MCQRKRIPHWLDVALQKVDCLRDGIDKNEHFLAFGDDRRKHAWDNLSKADNGGRTQFDCAPGVARYSRADSRLVYRGQPRWEKAGLRAGCDTLPIKMRLRRGRGDRL